MGTFRITITAVGGHGADRGKGNGEIVDFGEDSPEAIIKRAVAELQASGNSVTEAIVHHWPGTTLQVVDDLLSGKRAGSF